MNEEKKSELSNGIQLKDNIWIYHHSICPYGLPIDIYKKMFETKERIEPIEIEVREWPQKNIEDAETN